MEYEVEGSIPAYLGSPDKRSLNGCVCVCVLYVVKIRVIRPSNRNSDVQHVVCLVYVQHIWLQRQMEQPRSSGRHPAPGKFRSRRTPRPERA